MNSFGKKETYEDRIKCAISENNTYEVERVAREAFSDESSGEDFLAWVVGTIYERKVNSAIDLLENFIKRFPSSLHVPRVYFANILASESQFDGATHHARIYLRHALDVGVFESLQNHRIIQEGVSWAFLLVTAAYTELGARSYSSRALKYGLRLGLAPRWIEVFKQEILRIQQEITAPDAAQIDLEWEAFFSRGSGADRLHNLCNERKYHMLAKRVDLLETNFRFNSRFLVDESELLLLICSGENNVLLLR